MTWDDSSSQRATVHVVVPDGIDDPSLPSGGNIYDRRICDGLAATGWRVIEHAAPGQWPSPDRTALDSLDRTLDAIPPGGLVLMDGLVACNARAVVVPAASRVRVVVLVHMPAGDASGVGSTAFLAGERDVLAAATAVVTTSDWARRDLCDRWGIDPRRIHVVRPGADPAALAMGTPGGGNLLCVAAVTSAKGHDVMVSALAALDRFPPVLGDAPVAGPRTTAPAGSAPGSADLTWRLTCVGSLTRDPGFVESLIRQLRRAGWDARVDFTGPLAGVDLDGAYAAADCLVLPSRVESYGMVVTEALARGLPAIATHVGGISEALGRAPDGSLPGLLVPPDDPGALALAMHQWLEDASLRSDLRRAARDRRATLTPWSVTSLELAGVLTGVAG